MLRAIAFQKRSEKAFSKQREREARDLACQIPEGLWPEDVKKARQGGTIAGIAVPARPMLSIPKLDQPVQLQMNQMRSAHLGVQVHPVSKKANAETAKVKQGLYRAIERDSNADVARLWGADRALKCGLGWYRVNVVYDDATDDPDDLKIRLDRILHQGSVFPDPFAQQPDFSDGKELLVVSYMSWDTYKDTYPGSKLANYGDDALTELQKDQPFWLDGDAETRAACVAEYFYVTYRDREWVILDDGSFAFSDEIPQGRTRHATSGRSRKIKEPVVKVCVLNAVEELESSTWNGKYIPFVPCIGKELQTFDGERRWFGLYSTNRDSAHLFNVAVSNAVEVSALEPKAPYIGYVGQFKTNRQQWQLATVRNLPFLEADPVTVAGNLAPLPQRNLGGANLGPSIALIEIADNNLQAGTAAYDDLLGKNNRGDSAKKVLALQDQGVASNSHWLANLADISMMHEARIVLDLMPKVYDRPGRNAVIIGEDNDQREVVLNQPFTEDADTKRPVAVEDWDDSKPVPQGAKYYNLADGTYGHVVTVGKRFETRAREGADAFSQLLMSQPDLIKIVGDIWMGFQDFPGHELAAKRLKAAIPPEIANADKEDDQQPDPQALMQQLRMAEQGTQMMKQIIEEQGKAIETDAIKSQAENQRAEMENAAKIRLEDIKSKLAITLQSMKDAQALRLERLKQAGAIEAREDTQAHEVAMEAAGAAHEEHESAVGRQHDADMGRQAHESATLQGERGHEQALESGEQAQRHALEQGAMNQAGEAAEA